MTSTENLAPPVSQQPTAPPPTTAPQDDEFVPEEGTGWLFFAASMLGIAGIMRIFDSIWAFQYHGALPDGLKDGVLGSDLHNYAWLWLVVGAVLVLSSFLVLV